MNAEQCQQCHEKKREGVETLEGKQEQIKSPGAQWLVATGQEAL